MTQRSQLQPCNHEPIVFLSFTIQILLLSNEFPKLLRIRLYVNVYATCPPYEYVFPLNLLCIFPEPSGSKPTFELMISAGPAALKLAQYRESRFREIAPGAKGPLSRFS